MSDAVGVVIPAYRPDPARLEAFVADVADVLAPAELLVELDDAGSEVVERAEAAGATVHVADERRGKGAAITHGFERLDTDVLAFADADGSTTAEMLATVIDPVGDTADLAVGSRRHPDAVVSSHQTRLRRYLGDAFAALAGLALGADLYDFQCGAKALTADAWDSVREHLYETGFAWDLELIAVAAAFGLRIAEVPIQWQDREGSTVDPLWTTLDMLRALVAVRHRVKILEGSRLHRLTDRTDRVPLVRRDAR